MNEVRYLDLKGKGYIISDLHLFSEKSHISKYFNDIKIATREADYFILNGDIIDFIWSVFRNDEETIKIGRQWLENLIKGSRKCHFIYILGNHDCLLNWTVILDELSNKYSNFSWVKDYLISGKHMFFHGDLLIKPFPHLERRELIENNTIRGKVANFFYRTAVDSKIHTKSAALLFPENYCSSWISRTIEREKRRKNLEKNIEKIYFGHTHNSFEDYRYRDLRFYNTGSALLNSHLRLIEVK